MIQAIEKAELDAPSATIAKRWKAAGVPDLYEGANRADGTGGAVSRERADNIRAFLYPAPQQDEGKIERGSIPGPAGSIETLVVWPHPSHWQGAPSGTLVYFHGGGWVVGSVNSHRALDMGIEVTGDEIGSLFCRPASVRD